MNHGLAALEPEPDFRNLDAIGQHNGANPAPTLKFKTALVMELAAMTLDRLGADQRRATAGTGYHPEAAGDPLGETYRVTRRFEEALERAERLSLAQRFLDEHEDAIVYLARTIAMCDQYLKGEQT